MQNNSLNLKVGDYVKIKSLDWYYAKVAESGDIDIFICGENYFYYFTKDMTKYCDQIARVTDVNSYPSDTTKTHYKLDVDNGKFAWQDYMFDPEVCTEPLKVLRPIHFGDLWVIYNETSDEIYNTNFYTSKEEANLFIENEIRSRG